MDPKIFEPAMIDMYLPKHIESHMRMLGVSKEKADEFIKEVMNNPEKKAEYMKLIEEL